MEGRSLFIQSLAKRVTWRIEDCRTDVYDGMMKAVLASALMALLICSIGAGDCTPALAIAGTPVLCIFNC